jgi:RNA polymerase sigma factor (sigma-70 family)
MPPERTREGVGDLLDHEPFVRSLARNLLDDEHEAEDVVQETWLAALAHREQPCSSLRSWLGRVTWNVAVDRRRSRQRRLARERDAARSEVLQSVSFLFEREATRRQIVAALLGLEEPYRTALVLRFYHDLPPRKVAARQGVPVETARTRIKRALALLRTRLAGDHARAGHGSRPALV